MVRKIFQGNVTEEIVRGDNVIVFPLLPDEVRAQDYTRIAELFQVLAVCEKDAFQKIVLSFDYDDDPREIYDIPEIRVYLLKLLDMAPHMFYWFIPDIPPDHVTNQTYIMSMAGVKIVSTRPGFNSLQPMDNQVFLAIREKIKGGLILYAGEVDDVKGAKQVIEELDL